MVPPPNESAKQCGYRDQLSMVHMRSAYVRECDPIAQRGRADLRADSMRCYTQGTRIMLERGATSYRGLQYFADGGGEYGGDDGARGHTNN